MTTIAVTGGLGFIGSHLVRSFIDNTYRVIVIDDLSNHSPESLNEFSKSQNFELIVHDVSKPFPHIEETIEKVFHLAALVSVPDSFENPL